MKHVVEAYSLIELTIVIVLLGVLSIPIGGMVAEHMKAAFIADQLVSTSNLARFEQERTIWLSFGAIRNWCSVPRNQLPSESYCPVSVVSPNPYDPGLPYAIARNVEQQSPTDGSSSNQMNRITVKVFQKNETVPLAIVITYRANTDASYPFSS